MMSHSISVIVPAYKPSSFQFLRDSYEANKDINAEWIVIDDGSGAEYDSMFESADLSFATVMRQPENVGQAAARNIGFARSSGTWIKFLDADDRLDQEHLAALLAAPLNEKKIPFAPTKHVFASGDSWINNSWRDLKCDSNSQLARLLCKPFLHHCGALYSRELLEILGGYEPSLVTDEDGDLLIRALMAGYVFVPVEEVNYLYFHFGSSKRVSTDVGRMKLDSRLTVCDRLEASFDSTAEPMPDVIRRALALRMDKIAMAFWQDQREIAEVTLERAKTLCPDYLKFERMPLRILRKLGGLGAVNAITTGYRCLRGRPSGGMQG